MLKTYQVYLWEEEKSTATIEKYMRDLKKLVNYMKEKEVTKSKMIAYKEKLMNEDHYKISSINTYLVAANRFFEYMGWYDLKVKTYKIQNEAFSPENKNLSKIEYKRLLRIAIKKKKIRLSLIIQTLCATGMRVSEVSFVSVAAVKKGVVEVCCKGKVRKILLPNRLKKELLIYIRKGGIKDGIVFCTHSGNAIDRSNIWKEMKKLCNEAEVEESKVFPHNLRHLFAQCFYSVKRDVVKLADVLGHSSTSFIK